MTEVQTKEEVLVRSIIMALPQSQIVLDQVSEAINIAKAEAKTEEDFIKKLEIAKILTDYAVDTADSPLFVKYHLAIIALLWDVTDMSKLKHFETQANLIINGIKELQNIDSNKGVVARNVLHQAKLIQANQDLYLIRVLQMTQEVNTLLPEKDTNIEAYATLLETALIEQSIRVNKFVINEHIRPYVNDFMIALGKANL